MCEWRKGQFSRQVFLVSLRAPGAELADAGAVLVRVHVVTAVVDLGRRRRTDLAAPPVGPVELIHVEVTWILGVATHVHAVNQTADQRHEAKHQEHDSQYPEIAIEFFEKTAIILKNKTGYKIKNEVRAIAAKYATGVTCTCRWKPDILH